MRKRRHAFPVDADVDQTGSEQLSNDWRAEIAGLSCNGVNLLHVIKPDTC